MTINNEISRAVRNALLATALSAVGTSVVFAEAAAAAKEVQLEEVIVTGSRISSPNMQSISPVSTISSSDIAGTGKTRIEEILTSMPQIFAAQGAQVSNGSDGTATVNLRGLGANRTVVLINGRRVQAGSSSAGRMAADLDFIPAELIKRVEILTGGASSTYGADAVGGVVNFIMEDNFEGLKINAQRSFFNHHNRNSVAAVVASRPNYNLPDSTVNVGYGSNLSLVAGLNLPNGKGNATFYATYRQEEPILQASYDYSSCTLNSGDTFSCGGSTTTAPPYSNGRFRPLDPGTGGAIGKNATFLPDGSLQKFASTGAFAASQAYNFGPLNFYRRPDERYTLGSFMHYDLTDHSKLYTELMFMNDRNKSQIAPSGAFSLGNPFNPGGGLYVNCDNPFLSSAMVTEWCSGPTASTVTQGGLTNALLVIGRRNVEGGGRQQDFNLNSYRVVIGTDGDINDAWNYDVHGIQGATNFSSTYLNDLSWTNIQRSLLVQNVNGVPTCTSVIDGTDPSCVPWNIFKVGGVTKAAASYLSIPLLANGETRLRVLEASITGDLGKYGVKSPAADGGLKINVGMDWNQNTLGFHPDYAFQNGLGAGQGAATLPIGGQVTATEGFIEGKFPIAEGRAGMHELGVEFGYRNSSYKLQQRDNGSATGSFNANTFKLGVEWSPIQDLRLRASFQRASRVPNVGELYSPTQVGLDGTIDPCAGAAPAFTAAQCLNTGVTALQYGNVDNNPANQYNGLIGGNVNLKPEVADTVSFGVGYQPLGISGLRLQADYFDIKIDKAVQTPQADFTLIECGATGNAEACSRIHRDSAGSLLTNDGYVIDPTVNIGSVHTQGIDFDIGYHFGIGSWGKMGFQLNATHLNKYEISPQVGISYDCVGLYGPVCVASGAGQPLPKDRYSLRTEWNSPFHGLDIALTLRTISSVKVETTGGNAFLEQIGSIIGVPATDKELGSRNYLDLSASIDVVKHLSARLGVNNLTDNDPPLTGGNNCPAGPCNGNTYPSLYDATGRHVFFNLTAQF